MKIKEPSVSPLYYARFLIKNPSGQVKSEDGFIIRPKVWPRDKATSAEAASPAQGNANRT